MYLSSPDIDECGESVDNCDDNALCENTLSSFSCMCIAGYDGDGENCTSKIMTHLGLFYVPNTLSQLNVISIVVYFHKSLKNKI